MKVVSLLIASLVTLSVPFVLAGCQSSTDSFSNGVKACEVLQNTDKSSLTMKMSEQKMLDLLTDQLPKSAYGASMLGKKDSLGQYIMCNYDPKGDYYQSITLARVNMSTIKVTINTGYSMLSKQQAVYIDSLFVEGSRLPDAYKTLETILAYQLN